MDRSTQNKQMSRFELEKESRFEIADQDGSPMWKRALKTVGVLGSSMALMPGAGVSAAIELLPKISSDPEKPLIESGSLERAGEVLQQVMETPGDVIIKTPEEAEAVEKTGEVVSWPFRKAAEGLGLIGEHAIQPIAEKISGSKIPYLDPTLRTAGEAAAVFGLGGKLGGPLKKVSRGLSAKPLEAARMAGEAKYGRYATVPESVSPEISPKGIPLPSPETQFLRQQIKDRFLVEEPKQMSVAEAKLRKQKGMESSAETAKSLADELGLEYLGPGDGGLEYYNYGKATIATKGINRAELVEKMKTVEPYKDGKPETTEIPAKPIKDETGTTLYSGLPIHKAGDIWSKTVGTLLWDKAIMKGVPKILEKIPGGKSINRAFIYDYRGNLPKTETYIKSMEDMKRFQSVGREYAINLGNRLQKMPDDAQIRMGEFIRGEKVNLVGKELELASEAKQVLYDLGRQAVDVGLLGEETFFKNAGRYMPRLYESKEYQTLLTRYGVTKPNRLDLTRFKRRKDIPKEIREQMGEILTPGYPVAKGITQLTHDIEMARWFNGIAKNPEWASPKISSDPIPEGFVKLSDNKKLGQLSGAHVHPEIAADLETAIRVMETPERVWRKALGAWKFGKVIISPKTHVRNLMSNSVLAHLGGLPMYEQPIYLAKAASAMKAKGNYWVSAKESGLLSDTFTNAELRTLFGQVESQMNGASATSLPEKFGSIGGAWKEVKRVGGKATKLYEAEEQWFKMAKYIHNIERKKMSPVDAAKDAEKWLFNYSKVTKFQEKYRSKWYGAPFATFTFKAIPRITEAAIKTPWRFALPAVIIHQLEKMAAEKFGDTKDQVRSKKELRPDWMKGSFLGIPNFARMPVSDKFGREYYLNLSYILPWGDIGEGGGFGPVPGSLMPLSQPFIKEPTQQIMNYDQFWKEPIVKDSDIAGKTKSDKLLTAAKLRAKHVAQTLAPTPLIDISKGYSALKNIPDYKGRERPKSVVSADVFGGVKMYPVDYAEQLVKKINKVNPKSGEDAKNIKSQIRFLELRKIAVQKGGGDTSIYQKEIDSKIKQLLGLAEETKKIMKHARGINTAKPTEGE